MFRARALKANGKSIPNPVRLFGLVATGASGTYVDPVHLEKLDLSPTCQTTIHTPSSKGSPEPCNQYDVSITLIHPGLQLQIQAIPVIESELRSQGLDALIGRDILGRCLLVYDGVEATFTLAF